MSSISTKNQGGDGIISGGGNNDLNKSHIRSQIQHQQQQQQQQRQQRQQPQTESQRLTTLLSNHLQTLSNLTQRSSSITQTLNFRTNRLENLTAPASDASAALTLTSVNLSATIQEMSDTCERFETVRDCQPAMDRLAKGAQDAKERLMHKSALEFNDLKNSKMILFEDNNNGNGNGGGQQGAGGINNSTAKEDGVVGGNNHNASLFPSADILNSPRNQNIFNHNNNNHENETKEENASLSSVMPFDNSLRLTEQDVYAAADSLEMLRDAHSYFLHKKDWRSSAGALGELVNVHRSGVAAMCSLVEVRLEAGGISCRLKEVTVPTPSNNNTNDTPLSPQEHQIRHHQGQSTPIVAAGPKETAGQVRERLCSAISNRDLLQNVGEYREYLPLDMGTVRQVRAIFDCLGANGGNGGNSNDDVGCFLSGGSIMGMGTTTTTTNQTLHQIENHDINIDGSPSITLRDRNRNVSGGIKVYRSEPVGSGGYTNLVNKNLDSKYPHINAYAKARKSQARYAIDSYYRRLAVERTRNIISRRSSMSNISSSMPTVLPPNLSDSTNMSNSVAPSNNDLFMGEVGDCARDTVRLIEHAMVVVQGEKSIYKCVVSPTSSSAAADTSISAKSTSLSNLQQDDAPIPPEYKRALVQSYSHVVAVIVDCVVDATEHFFVKDARLGQSDDDIRGSTNDLNRHGGGSGGNAATSTVTGGGGVIGGVGGGTMTGGDGSDKVGDGGLSMPVSAPDDVRFAVAAAAASLRILDGVRMLGPSLGKLCEAPSFSSTETSAHTLSHPSGDSTIASSLCITIHRLTVKNSARSLERLVQSIKEDPLDGERNRPSDARVAAVSSNVVRTIRIISPFVSAYRSVAKRQNLPWDPRTGRGAGEIGTFVKYLIVKLLHNLQAKMMKYMDEPGSAAQARGGMFMMNNTFYLHEQLGLSRNPSQQNGIQDQGGHDMDGEDYKITGKWFPEQVDKMFEKSKKIYLKHWEDLNSHLTAVDQKDLNNYKSAEKVLKLESGRLLKSRFSGFNEEFEKIYQVHREFSVIDPKLRKRLAENVLEVFLPKYEKFYNTYSVVQFSKKQMNKYLKYPPEKIKNMIEDMYSTY